MLYRLQDMPHIFPTREAAEHAIKSASRNYSGHYDSMVKPEGSGFLATFCGQYIAPVTLNPFDPMPQKGNTMDPDLYTLLRQIREDMQLALGAEHNRRRDQETAAHEAMQRGAAPFIPHAIDGIRLACCRDCEKIRRRFERKMLQAIDRCL